MNTLCKGSGGRLMGQTEERFNFYFSKLNIENISTNFQSGFRLSPTKINYDWPMISYREIQASPRSFVPHKQRESVVKNFFVFPFLFIPLVVDQA